MTVKLHLLLFHCDFISITMSHIEIQIRILHFLSRNFFQTCTHTQKYVDDGKDLARLSWKTSRDSWISMIVDEEVNAR